MNTEWHKKNKMPKKITVEQRRKWHVKHAKYRGCRPIPQGILAPRRSPLETKAPRDLLMTSVIPLV